MFRHNSIRFLCYELLQLSFTLVSVRLSSAGKYDNSVDVYAFGILFWYLCSGSVKLPEAFERCSSKDQLWTNVKKGNARRIAPEPRYELWVNSVCVCCFQARGRSDWPRLTRSAGSWWRPAGTETLPRDPCLASSSPACKASWTACAATWRTPTDVVETLWFCV